MLGTLELPRLLHAILAGISAGGAAGLGFNRAILMLVDAEAGMLRAEMAVGPENAYQAQQIWSEVSGRYRTLQDFLQDYDQLPPPEERALSDLVTQLAVPLAATDRLPMSTLVTGETVHVLDAYNDPRVSPEFLRIMESSEFVIAPLLVGRQRIGVAVADNFVTKKPIRGSDVHLLTSLANQAAFAVDRAQLYREAQERAEELAEAIEDLKAAEQELLRNERLATIGHVTAAVAHEIRNPLSTIGGFARSIVRDPEEFERNQRNAQIIIDEVDRLEELLRGLLDFSRPERMRLEPMALQPVIASVLEWTENERSRSQATLDLDLPEDLPQVNLDANQFRQVLLNLIKNAVEAMPEGGVIRIRGRATERGVELTVSDSGAGIEEEDLQHIFDSFFTTKPTGTGLGLALVRKILDAHGATIEAYNAPGNGAVFTIVFPYT
jgi:signal transduction histidine kinase